MKINQFLTLSELRLLRSVFFGFILFSILWLSSCATYIDFKVLKPAQVDIGPVKKIAVLDFEYKGSWNFLEEYEPETFTEIAKEAWKKIVGVDKEKSSLPDPLTAYPGKEISNQFITKLVENGHYDVIERDQLSKLLAEQELQMSGIIDPNHVAEVGRVLGVEAIIVGNGNYIVNDEGGWYEQIGYDKNGNEYKYSTYKIFRKVDTELTYRIVNVSTGEIMASKTNKKSNYNVFVEKEDEKTARANIPEWYPIVDKLTKSIVKKSIKQIAPHYVTQKRLIKVGKSKGMKVGLEYAKRGLWEEAKEAWESVLEMKSNQTKEDQVLAKYNLGIYYEIHGDLDTAEKYFDECFKESGNSSYLDDKARMQKRKEENKKLKNQQAEEQHN